MCGLAGLICRREDCRGEDHAARVAFMCERQHHRGPDDRGVTELGRVCLGAVRLSILDLSPAGHMPMADEAGGRHWIVYNGEVYNYRSLREELVQRGHRFRSGTDTEVVLHAFREWGLSCVERFVGMFAFAVYDRERDELCLVRDRFGIKPLYWCERDGHVYFSSEVKALVAAAPAVRIDERSLVEWFFYQNVDVLTPHTLIDGVRSVLPGSAVVFRGGERTETRYYSPPARVQREEYERLAGQRPAAVVEAVEGLLAQAVEDRLLSDVPVGTLLSGGLDSSLVTALAARRHPGLKAFHVSVEGRPDLDERRHAEAAARHLGVELVCAPLNGAAFRRELVRTVYASDLPLTHPNSVAYSIICRVAREHGVIVLQSGEGADELFGGYEWRYRREQRLHRLRRLLALLPRKLRKGIEFLGYASAGLPVTSHRFEALLPHAVQTVDRRARSDWSRACADAYGFVASAAERAVLGAMLADLADFLTPLLRRLDRTSMQSSVEVRVPFLDHRLVETAIHLPLRYRLARGRPKWILQEIGRRHLPAALAGRRKRGFPIPLADYLGPLARPETFASGFCAEFLGLRAAARDAALASWRASPLAFLNLVTWEVWGRLFFRREPLADVEAALAAAGPPAG